VEQLKKTLRYAGLTLIFAFFMLGGSAHFTQTEMFVSIMPPYIPYHLEIVYLSGVMEIAGALALLVPKYRALAGVYLIALTIAVTPANIHMWLNPQLFPGFNPVFLSIRLVLQVALIAVIWFSTRTSTQQGY
jgi:uncharacterized membrane protein